jgi:N-acetylneuraminic acid mutarotase
MRIVRRLLPSACIGVFLVVCAGVVLPAGAQTTAPNEWTWVGGSGVVGSSRGQPGVYGTLGTAATGNIPGGRASEAAWTDSSGNFWLFGGEGFDANDNQGYLNDLWEFNPSTGEWAWMGGSSTLPASCAGSTTIPCGPPGLYGTLGTPSTLNVPGGRWGPSNWTDTKGNLWLFGGYGLDASGNLGELNDLWEFNPATKLWTWMAGSSTVGANGGQPGNYGTLGIATATNVPSGRDSSTDWIDKDGNLWLYGGEGFDAQGVYAQLDDLWEFDTSTNEWVWIGGSSTVPALCAPNTANDWTCGWPPIYGALGVPATGNTPGSRGAATSWTDSGGNFWLFGGLGTIYGPSFDFSLSDQSDLWEFIPSVNEWAWMGGNNSLVCDQGPSGDLCGGENGVFGTLGTPAVANIPASRSNAASWTNSDGSFWLFGGNQSLLDGNVGLEFCNDTWEFTPSANEWAWMNGSSEELFFGNNCQPGGVWGVLGTPSAENIPSGRIGFANWTDRSGNFWIFGGLGWIENGQLYAYLNDLWVYKPVTPAPIPSFELVASPNPITIGAIGYNGATTGTTAIGVVTADGFDSPVTLTAATDTMNGVTDITGSLSPSTIAGAGSSQLTVSVYGAAGLVANTYPLTITGTGGGVSQSVVVSIMVSGVTPMPLPTFSVAPGTYPMAQTVAVNDSGEFPLVYYTTDGSMPTVTSPSYVSPITVSSTTTLKAIAIDPTYTFAPSAVATATYAIGLPAAATPAFSVPAGTYAADQSVAIMDATAGATIYYTTDGTAPTTGSMVYGGPIPVMSTETIEAIATASGYSTSAVATATYTIPQSFTLSLNPTSITVKAGRSGTSLITLQDEGGFNGNVSFACMGLPAGATCSFAIDPVPTPPGITYTTLTVSTASTTAEMRRGSGALFPGAALAVAICCFGLRKRRRLLMLAVGAAGLGVLGGCGGGTQGIRGRRGSRRARRRG